LRWLVYTILLVWTFAAQAEAPQVVEGNVLSVDVTGTRRIDEAAVLAAMGLAPGERLTASKVRRDLKAIYRTGFFEDVRIEAELDGTGVRVVVQIEEKPAIRDVRIEGNKKIDEEDIREVLDVYAFSVLNEAKVKDSIALIRDLYLEKGFYLAEIEVETRDVGDDQVEVVFQIQENRKVIIQRIEFSGNDNLPDWKIKRWMQTKEGGFAPWLTSTGNFRQEVMETDLHTISAVYLEEGYVDVRVAPPKAYLSPDKRYIFISYHIDEGPQYQIGELGVRGDFVPEEGLTEDRVMEIMDGRVVADIQDEQWRDAEGKSAPFFHVEGRGPRVRSGDIFRYSTISSVMTSVSTFYEDQGYAFVNVMPQTVADPDTQEVALTLVIERGEKMRIGRINISGNDPTFDKVIRRELQIREGDVYRGSRIRASRFRLERLGYFETVDFATPRGDGPDVLDLNISVTEQSTGSFSLGMGYSNLEKFVLTASVSKNNFLGLGYVMSGSINWSSLRRQGSISIVDPYFLDSRWTFKIDGYYITREFQLNEYQRGGSVGIGRYLDRRDDVQLRLDYTIEDVGLTSLDAFRLRMLGGDLYRNGLTSSLGVTLSVDRRNNRIFATKGIYTSFTASLAGGFRINEDTVLSLLGGEFNFVETRFNLRFFQPLIPNSDFLVFRLNTTMGAMFSTDGQVIPFIHRYRPGGINSVRGFQWFSLGPTIRAVQNDDPARADDKLIVGGTQTWVNNIEIESALVRAAGISGVVFFDAGNAFGDPWGNGAMNPFGLRTSVGAGIRWRSPIGPLRFEVGFPLKPQDDEKKTVFDFSIGSFF
jgi:outer membrane protein insertion porin family